MNIVKIFWEKAGIKVLKMVVVCVVGIGRLGGNIAGDLAFNGHTVRVWDKDAKSLNQLHERIDYEKKRLKEDKIMTYPEMLVRNLIKKRPTKA